MSASLHLDQGPLALPVVLAAGIVCLLLAGFFSGAETGAMSLSRARIHLLRRRKSGRRAVRSLANMLTGIEDIVMTCLIGTNLFNVVFSALVTVAVTSRLGPDREWVAVLLVSVLVILFSEIIPKVMYREFPERLMLASVWPLELSRSLLWPVRLILGLYSRMWRRLLGSGGEAQGFDRRGLTALLLSHEVPGDHEERFTQLIQRFLHLAQRQVVELAHPVAEMVMVDPDTAVGACLDLAARSGYSRLPIQDRNGRLEGYVPVRDLLFMRREAHGDPVPDELRRPLLLVDGRMSPYELFEDLRNRQEQLAAVAAPDGKVLGLISLEDLIETVVGSISDEFDPETKEES